MCMKAYEIPLSLYYYIERKEELQKLQKKTSPKNNNACEHNQPTNHPHTFESHFRLCVNSNSNPKSQKPSHCIALFSFWVEKKIH